MRVTISLDAMGGDRAPLIVIEGASLALKKNRNIYFKIFGDEKKVLPIIKKFSNLNGNYEFYHTSTVISSDDKPAVALRQGRSSSMRLAIDCVKHGHADAVVSAGNTGALMAISKFVFNTINGIDRPAIATPIPTKKNSCVLLDLGANAESSAEQLFQFAIMGDSYAKALLGISKPRVGLLNIGSEALKGNKLVQETAELLLATKRIYYTGFAEGNDIFSGDFDVIVTDGFTGNIALKVLEGSMSFIKYKLIGTFTKKYVASFGLVLLLLFSFFSIRKTYGEIDPRRYNGAMLLGLDGISVKSHGGADRKSFANAIDVAYRLVVNHVNSKIKEELADRS